jgi:hypothetical protein
VKVVVSRQGGGREQRAEHALQSPGGDQHAEVGSRTAERRSRGEAEQADHEGPLAAEEIGQAAAEEEQRAEGERVGRDDPLAVAVGEAEVGLSRRERDVHDRRVEHDHQLSEGDGREGPPPPGGDRRGHGRGGSCRSHGGDATRNSLVSELASVVISGYSRGTRKDEP